jgi:hypothetical protein
MRIYTEREKSFLQFPSADSEKQQSCRLFMKHSAILYIRFIQSHNSWHKYTRNEWQHSAYTARVIIEWMSEEEEIDDCASLRETCTSPSHTHFGNIFSVYIKFNSILSFSMWFHHHRSSHLVDIITSSRTIREIREKLKNIKLFFFGSFFCITRLFEQFHII